MKRKLLLCSHAEQIIGKVSFLFDKPVAELKTICITTAANVYKADNRPWLDSEMQAFRDFGFNLIEFDLKGKHEAQVRETLQDADVIYVTGGNSYYLLEQMQICNFRNVIEECLQRDALYIGSSAGSVVACPSIDFIGDLDDPKEGTLENDSGLNLIGLHIMPHIDHPAFAKKILGLIDKVKEAGIMVTGLKDSQAILLIDNYLQVI